MPNKLTLLRTQLHGEFLAAQRQDPVTAKVFSAGDRITLCTTCLLPFLKESWRGIGGTHCGQSSSVGLEAEQTSAEASTNHGEIKSDDGANGKNAEELADQMIAKSEGLNPIPTRLHPVPITLRLRY